LQVFAVNLKRPRDRTSPEVNRIRREILELLERSESSTGL
jgi:ABC-type nitrate/sulfonate/bicarbonate transport system ATPase subunit